MENKTMKQFIIKIFHRDSFLFGIGLGVVIPLIFFGILYAISICFSPAGKDYLIKLPTIVLVSVFTNLFTFRHYLIKLKFDRTGRGILLMTFISAIAYFVMHTYFFE
jgi:membrane protease YdiL (CAAX protease family)